MADSYELRFDRKAVKQLKKLDRQTILRIKKFLTGILDDPFLFGKALKGDHSGLWRYRVGDFRIVCEIKEGELIVLVLKVGHRKDVYRR